MALKRATSLLLFFTLATQVVASWSGLNHYLSLLRFWGNLGSGQHSLFWAAMLAKEAQMKLRCFSNFFAPVIPDPPPEQELYPMAEDMEMSSSYDEPEYEEYAEEAEARIEPFRRRRKPYRLLAMCSRVFFC